MTSSTATTATIFGPAGAGHIRLEWPETGLARLVLCNPARRNAISLAMWQGLATAMDQLEADTETRAVILTGAGNVAFTAGADLSEFGDLRADPEAVQRYNTAVGSGMCAIRDASLPVLAVIRGKCIGAGVALSAMADLRIGDRSCEFGIPAARLGIAYDPDWIAQLVTRCGAETVAELLLFDARLSGATAQARGLVAQLHDDAALEEVSLRLVRAAASGEPQSHRASKAALVACVPVQDEAALAQARALANACDQSVRYRQSIQSYSASDMPMNKTNTDIQGRDAARACDPMNCNLTDLMLNWVARDPDAPAIISFTSTLSYGAFGAMVARMRKGLAAAGVAKGDRVISIAGKSPEAIALFFAVTGSGVVYVPVNPALTDPEISVIVAESEASLLVVDSLEQSKLGTISKLTLAELDDGVDAEAVPTVGQGVDPAVMLFTSGTTGKPKGSVQTHRNLATNFASLGVNWGMGPDDTLLHVLPIYHGHGLFLAAGCPLSNGVSLRLLPKFDLARILELLPQSTVLMGVPTIYARLLESSDFTAKICENLRLGTSGSAPLSLELRDRFEERTGIKLLERYGSTETGMIASNPLDGERRRGSVGLPYDNVEYRIEDANGNPVAVGEVGRLFVRSPYINAGYWQTGGTVRPNVDDRGFFDTEDLVKQDRDGYLSIVGRAKDLIISGGLNIYPREVEIALEDIAEIAEATVVGVPHPDYGEAVVAVVVARAGSVPDSDAIIATLKKRLSGYKCPKRVEFVQALPRNEMGKVIKRDLADQFNAVFTDIGGGKR